MRKFFALSLTVALLIYNSTIVYACDENQTNNYVTEILFGDEAASYKSNENTKLLLNALYLCSEQSDNLGQEKIDFLKLKKVGGVPSISDINIKNGALNDCSHICWEYDYAANNKARSCRKKILQNTVNKVFDFGLLDNLFGSGSGKCNSFAALLYYSHILSDYLADDPEATESMVNGKNVEPFKGEAFTILNGNQPFFSSSQKKSSESYVSFSPLDSYGRSGVAFAVLGKDTLASSDSKQNIGMIKPSGWNQQKYPGIVNSEGAPYLFHRCHLIAHQLAGNDDKNNLITGTNYLNETGMKPNEKDVADYIKNTGNHVLYRVTPIYKGDNLIASGVQMEAYSIEDSGKLHFNVYCYNVQPGININYASGNNEQADTIINSKTALPFSVNNPSDSNPDLIYEIKKHLDVLFEDQKNSSNYTTLIGDLNSIRQNVQTIGSFDEKPAQTYIAMKEYEYKLFESLKRYIPILLKNEEFFKSAFN